MAGLLDRLESGALSTDFSLDSLELADDASRQQVARDFTPTKTQKALRSPILDQIERDADREHEKQRIRIASHRVLDATPQAPPDTWAQVGKKALQNIDDRYGQAAGGLIAALPEIRNELSKNLPGSPLVADVVNMLAARVAQPLDAKEREIGKGISDRASAELARNAPEIGDSFAKRFSYDLFGSMVDLSAAVAVGVGTRSPSAGAAVVATQVWGQQFAESVAKGRTEGEAFGDASFMAAAELIPETMALHEIMKPGQKFLGRVLKGALAEGMQESITQVLQDGYSKGILNENMTWGDVLANSAYAGLLGAAAGGPVAGGAHLVETTFGQVDKPGIVETFSSEAQTPTQEDIDSPIPTEIIQKGKAELAAVTAKNDINDLLASAGLPGVGERITLTKPDGSQHIGTLTDIFQGEADAPGTGVKLAMDDGSTFSEYLDTLHDAKYTLGRFKAPAPDDVAADMHAPPPAPVDFILPAKGRITSPFGHRTAPKEGASTDHGGVDIAMPVGTPVGATAGGTVADTGSGGKRGNWIEIDHGNGLRSRYFHLDSVDVKKGDPVNQGQVIGKSGATGNVTGAHLHWSVLKNGTPIDPMTAGLKGPGEAAGVISTHEDADSTQKPNILDEPLISNRPESGVTQPTFVTPEATQPESTVDRTVTPPVVTFKDTPSGKGFVLGGATEEQIAEIKRALPKVDMVPNNRGEITFSKKREETVRSIIDRMSDAGVLKDSYQQPSGDGSRTAPIIVTHEDHMQPLMDRVNTEPTEAQKEAGNYTKGHVQVQGIDITIENPKGSERSGLDPNGKPWSVTMPNHYGYVKRTTGADAENVDVYIGPNPQAQMVYVVDQNHSDNGKFDEHKAMLGYNSQAEAEAAYKAGFSDGKGAQRMGAVVPMHVDQFKEWLKTEPQKPAAEAVQPDMLGGPAMTESQLAARDNAQGVIDAARSEDNASDALILKTLDHIETGLADKRGAPLDPSHYVDRDAPEAVVDAVRKNKAMIAAIRAALGDKRTEHPGLVIKSLQTGKETTIQPASTRPPSRSKDDGLTDYERKTFEATALDYDTTDRHERVQLWKAAGVTSAMMPGSPPKIAERGERVSFRTPQNVTLEGKVARVRQNEAGRTVYDIDVDGGGLQNAFADEVKIIQKSKPVVSDNTIWTDDAAEKARAILKAKLSGNQLNSGIDPEVMQAGITLAGYHIEKGARTFAAYAQAMIDDLGEVVRPYLRSWYEGVRYHPAMTEISRDMSGAEDIGRAQADLENGRGNQGSLRAGDAGAGAANAQRVEPDRGVAGSSQREGGGSAEDVRRADGTAAQAPERGGARSGSETGGGTGSSGRPDRVSEAQPSGRGRGDDTTADDAQRVTGQNWIIEPGSLDEARGAAIKARDNVRAIEIVKELDESGRPATREQQEVLAKYVGWGGLKNAFNETNGEFPKGFETIGPRVKELLTSEEYDTARRSIQYAHYTAEKVVRPMWDAAVRLGFKGGRVFEPGMGTGNFLGMMPPEIAANTQYAGLEFDYVTARIAQLLYPRSGIQHADFTKVPLAKNAYDLVIGNPPFSGTVIRSDPEYGKLGFVLHDFFFAKSLDAVRPGGLLMFVTSAGTMNKVGSEARQYMADRADLVGAVRLAGDAFKENAGTEVTTDIIVLRKRIPGEAPGDTSWVETINKELPNRDGGQTTGSVSRYFEQHPDMVLGEEGFFDRLAAGERYAVRARPGQDTGKLLANALESLGSAKMIDWQTEQAEQETDFESEEHKDGSYYLKDGKLYQQRGQVGVPVEGRGKGVKGGMSAKNQERVRALVPIRDALREVFKHDLGGRAEKADEARKTLNREYDRFVQKYGPINKAEISTSRPTVIQQESARNAAREEIRLQGGFFDEGSFDSREMIANKARLSEIAAARRDAKEMATALGREWDDGTFDPEEMPDNVIIKRPNIDPFMDDQEGYRLRAIEHYNEKTGEAKKGRIFFENVITKERAPEINSPQDALLYVLNRRGHPDLDEIASLAKMSRGQVIEALDQHVFKIPGHGETYQTREMYLSGNVRKKLEIAKAEAARDPSLERNVEALEAVQPAPLGPSDISAGLGMPWIPSSAIEDFGRSLGLARISVKYSPRIAQWRAEGDNNSAAARSEWGTQDRGAIDLINAALNRTEVKVYTKVYDPQTGKKRDVIDPEATQAAQDKMLQIKQKFAEWIWQDTQRADALAALYNRDYNNLVAPAYDGSYLTTPGISSEWSWRPHQTRVIARIIQSGNTYMAHAVGAGKTSAMIGAGQEMRRLGLVRKPMYVVPNHMLGQFTKEFYEQYPTAKIMVADERQFHTDRRKQFIANVAANDLDAVIITHSAFGFIPMSDEFTERMVKEKVEEFRDILREMKSEGGAGDRFTQRNIEKQIENLQQKLEGKGKGKKRDQVFTFEEMGVDFLFIDEAHLFRKLDFATKMNNVRGIDPNGSDMSFDLFAKTRYLEDRAPGRSHVLASGTPVTNTMAELFSLSRYQQMQELKERNIDQFDAWAGAFGDTVTALEQDPAGGYKPQTRFAKFVNVPELSAMVRQVMDVVTSKQLEQYVVRPRIKGGRRQMILAHAGADLESFQQSLQRRMEAISKRKGPPRKGDDILLSVIGDGRKAAIDMRLIDAGLTRDEGSKLEKLIENVSRIAKETENQGFHRVSGHGYEEKPYRHGPATQMIFSDLGINGDFPVHKYIANQLVSRGLKRSEVAIISDYKSHVARQRLFNDMNEGKVRVLIGSVPKMGTGVNAQRQLYAIHNLDPQWYPANDEQRNGRGLRQGNQNPEIEIVDYSTKGTYDSQMWQLMETKARFIEGFFNGDPTMRSMEDLGEASQYEQAKAITTADPRILEMTQYKQDLERALLRKGAHEREQFSLRSRLAAEKDHIRANQEKLPYLEKDIAQRQDITGDAFKATVMGQEFDERAAWGEAVKERVDSLIDQEQEGRDQKIGEIGGFKLTADIVKIGRDWLSGVYLNFNGDRQEQVSASTPAGIATSIGNTLRNLEGRIEKAKDAITQAERRIEDFTPQLDKKFTGQAEIDELQGKVNAIEAQLTAESKAKEAGAPAKESRGATDREVSQAEVDEVRAQLKVELKRLDPMGRVNLSVVDHIAPGISGRYWPREARIAVSVGANRPPIFSLGHEFVHHLRAMGFYTPSEWRALTDHVTGPNGAAIMESVRQRYDDLSEQEQIEEGIADLFGARYSNMRSEGMVARALVKMADFVQALYNSLRGRSNAVRDIFLRMESGEIASRDPGLGGIGVIKDSIVGGTSASPNPETVSEALAPARTLVGKVGETFDEWRTWAQDRMLPLMRTQAAAERILGRTLEEHENAYLGEELMSGKVGAQLEHLSDKLVAPLFEAMKAENINVDELESYLYARHAPERNEQIDKINPEMDGRGSGMSNIEAEAIMNRIEDDGRTAGFERVARYVDGIIKFSQETRVETELLSEDQLDAMREAYKHYVPLRGFEELNGAEGERPKQGAGISVRGPESKRAFGRRSRADDILAYSIMQAEEAIIRGQKNMVARKLYNLAREAKDEDFWKISPVTMRRKLNPMTGFVETVPDRTLSAEDAPYTVSLKVDGKEKRVTMNKHNPAAVRLAESMRRLDEQQVGKVIQFMGKVNRWLSAANTSFNPEFVITNAFRDIQTAGVNLAGIDVKGIELATLKDYPKAMVGSMRGAFGNDTGEWGKWYREFVDEGGRVFFNQVQDLDTLKAKIEREFKHARDVNLTPQTAALKAYSGMKAIGEWIGNVNNGVENAIRLSAYKNGRQRGMSPAQAASLAKNLTVNFNRRGAGGTTVNALYLFYNASMQGTARMLAAMKSRRVQKILVGTVAFSAALDALNMMISGRDDDDELYYDKISDFEKSRNLIIMMPGGSEYLKIPLPYGYNVFAALGRSMSEILRGRNAQNSMANLASTTIDAFNPIGGAKSILNVLAPTIFDPIVDLVRNRDFADRPIMPDQPPYQSPVPDNQRFWGSVNPLWKAVTDSLNKVSGGDDVVPGYVDMSPETLEYLFGVTFGAAGAFYDRTVGLGEKIIGIGAEGDDPIERNDIPLVRKVTGEKPRWYDKAALYARMEQVQQTLDYAKGYAEKGDREGFNEFVGKNFDVVSMEGQLKQTRREMRQIKKERSEAIVAKDRGKIDAAEFREINTRLDSIQEKVIANFNRAYIKTVKKPIGPS